MDFPVNFNSIFTLFFIFVLSTRGAEFIDDESDSIVIEAIPDEIPVRSSRSLGIESNAAEGFTCLTSKGEVGVCTTFKDCYPFFSVPDLTAIDSQGYVLGVFDNCEIQLDDGRTGSGVCCRNGSSNNSPSDSIGHESHKSTTNEIGRRPNYSWPPPLPTHPPHHTIPPLPTHPPSLSLFPGFPSLFPSHNVPSSTNPPTTSNPVVNNSESGNDSVINQPSLPSAICGAKNGDQNQEAWWTEGEDGKIVGGRNAKLGEWPWIVALFRNGRHICGGSLIDDRHILTAAHCVANMNSVDVARLLVRLGDHDIRSQTEVRHVDRRVKRIARHRGFNVRTLYNDVALLTMSEPVEFTEQIRPICLPTGSQLYNGQKATVIGWGSIREKGPSPSILQQVTIPIWTNSLCKQKYGLAAPGGIVDSFICAGDVARDSCSGDSGGPLMVNDGRWTQIGIVSWGIGCGQGQYPGVYTRVTHFLPWIYKNLK